MRRMAAGLVLLALATGLAACGLVDDDRVEQVASPLFGPLKIHQINVGWGSSVLIEGPDGTTVLLEGGDTGDGTNEVVPYLQSVGHAPAGGLDYTIAGHQHCDHMGGLDEVINAGYDVHIENYYNGSSYSTGCVTQWNAAAATTTAGPPVSAPVGTVLQLGDGATLTVVVRNGNIIGGGSVSVSDENDRSIGVLVQYGGFDYLWASDLGGGDSDFACTGRSTAQNDVESFVVQAISPGGAAPLISAGGIDVLYVNHHGSESSTNANWMNLAEPALAIIATGAGQSSGWDFPRIDVLEHVLYAEVTCVTVPEALVLQTEEGAPIGSATSLAGYSVGNIVVTTDGVSTFTVAADGQVNQGPNEVAAAGLPRTLDLDDVAGCIDAGDCTDGVFCNGAEACVAGACQPGTPVACDDGVSCTSDACNEGTDSCDFTPSQSACDNGQFCDGSETCHLTLGCQSGTPPTLDDGVACTADSCDEGGNTVVHAPDDGACGNGLFCDGAESCHVTLGCQSGTPPTNDGVACTADSCDEETDTVAHVPDHGACDDQLFCDGVETCHVTLGCQAGTPPNADDGVACTVDGCDEGTDTFTHSPSDPLCDDGLFCDGAETCHVTLGCQAGTPPSTDDGVACTADSCDEVGNTVVHTPDDGACGNGLFCDGAETCNATLGCQGGASPDCSALDDECVVGICDEGADACAADPLPSGNTCSDGDACTEGDQCDGSGVCAGVDACFLPLLHFAIKSTTTTLPGGLVVADEDIVTYDPNTGTFALTFDGSDVGLPGTAEIDALAHTSGGDFLISLETAASVPGLVGGPSGNSVDDSDIIRFTPTSLGANTSGTFTFYFDGSDVGLTTDDEDVDGLAIEANGDLLLSTLGQFSVTGASGQDEDVLEFQPSALGSVTSGTHSLYFDGSDVGLSSSNEDVDGVCLAAGGDLLVSTLGNASVPGVSAENEDVLQFTATGLGGDTSGTWSLYFDGTAVGLDPQDLGAIDLAP